MMIPDTIWCGFKPEFIPHVFNWGFTTGTITMYKSAINDETETPSSPNTPINSGFKPKIIK